MENLDLYSINDIEGYHIVYVPGRNKEDALKLARDNGVLGTILHAEKVEAEGFEIKLQKLEQKVEQNHGSGPLGRFRFVDEKHP